MPSLEDIWRVASLGDYNTRLVVISTTLLGIACGLIGTFLLMRKRSLMADALSHATLPGIALAFMIMVSLGMTGRDLPGLLAGAMVTGVTGFLTVQAILAFTRLKDDAAMGIVLGVFFGAGIVLLRLVQGLPGASAAGLESFIYGKTASMLAADFWLISGLAVVSAIFCSAIFKELRLLCFDENFAAVQGWPVRRLDALLLSLITVVTVIGLQAVGLILIIAFLIIPPAAARFWSERLDYILAIAVLVGGISGWVGASLSALTPRLPAGAVIVLTAAGIFLLSMLFGSSRGVVFRYLRHRALQRKVGQQHLLRAAYEILELETPQNQTTQHLPVPMVQLRNKRSWSERELREFIRIAIHDGMVRAQDEEYLHLSLIGLREAARVARNHRLWEIYLIEYADVAPAMVDRDADAVEHVLGEELVRKLEEHLFPKSGRATVPASPHPIPSKNPSES